jgi:hypothetical protein
MIPRKTMMAANSAISTRSLVVMVVSVGIGLPWQG